MYRKEDFKCVDGWYYIGNIIDMDGSPWVLEHQLEIIISDLNNGHKIFELKPPLDFVPFTNNINDAINYINLN